VKGPAVCCERSVADPSDGPALRVNDVETLPIAPDNQGDQECPPSCRTIPPPSLKAHLERFVRGGPVVKTVPVEVWINRPEQAPAKTTPQAAAS